MSDKFRILVTGSRDWTDSYNVMDQLDQIYQEQLQLRECEDIVLVHGACPTGADKIAAEWGSGLLTVESYPANWDRYGKKAGFIRNSKMVNLGANICLAFIKDDSPGATMTLNLAKKAGIPCKVFRA